MIARLTDDAVAGTLKRMESNERMYRAAFFGAVAVEALFLAAFLVLADLRDRTHLLLLLGFASLLSLGALGAVALSTFVNRHTLRVLRGVELLRAEVGGRAPLRRP